MLLGAGGFIGRVVETKLLNRGHKVVTVSRSPRCDQTAAANHIQASRADPARIADIYARSTCDILIDMVAHEGEETRRLMAHLDGLVSRYVVTSSGDVYRNFGMVHGLEQGPLDLDLLDETGPLRTSRHPYRLAEPRADTDPHKWMDTGDKVLMEEAVRESRSEWTICRLPMVYGPHDPQMRFMWAYAPMMAGAERLDLPGSWLDWTVTHGHVETVAAAIVHAALHPGASRRTFNITEDETPVPHSVWVERLASVIGWTGEVVRTDDPEHPVAQATAALDLSAPLLMSGERLRKETGFEPALTVDQALRTLIAA